MPIEQTPSGAIVATGDGIQTYHALVIQNAMKGALLGMRPNRHWTNRRMLDRAAQFTGRTYKGSSAARLREAIADLELYLSPGGRA